MEENIKRKDRDEIRPKNNLQWKWQWFKEFYFLCVGGCVCVCTDIRYLVETEDKRKKKKEKVSTGEFYRLGVSTRNFVHKVYGRSLKLGNKRKNNRSLHRDAFLRMCVCTYDCDCCISILQAISFTGRDRKRNYMSVQSEWDSNKNSCIHVYTNPLAFTYMYMKLTQWWNRPRWVQAILFFKKKTVCIQHVLIQCTIVHCILCMTFYVNVGHIVSLVPGSQHRGNQCFPCYDEHQVVFNIWSAAVRKKKKTCTKLQDPSVPTIWPRQKQ